jgi:hypothetical protein
MKPGGGSLLRVGSSLRIFVAPLLRDDDDVDLIRFDGQVSSVDHAA